MTAALVPSRPRRRQTPLDAFQASLATAQPLPTAELHAVTGWLIGVKSDQTRSAYARDLGQFTGFIAGLDGSTLTTATPTHVNAWWQHMRATPVTTRAGARPRAAKTIARKLSAVSSFYTWATEPGGCWDGRPNPARPVKARRTPKDAGRRTAALSADQLGAVVSACPDPAARALVLLLATTGARISEALGADRGDWREREGHHVLSVLGKREKRRDLQLPSPVIEALTATGARARHPSAPLFCDPAGNRLTYGQAAYLLEVIGARAGLGRRLAAHQFRATYATRCRIDLGADVASIATQLGHASTEMTQIYIREAQALAVGAELNERLAQAIVGGRIEP